MGIVNSSMKSAFLICCFALCVLAQTQKSDNDVPVIDAGMGPCTADVTVFDSAHRAVYKANISTQIRSGFAGVKKLDLQVGTNVDGKARFTGLPEKPREVWQLTADFEGRNNSVMLDSRKDCHAMLSIFLPDKPVSSDK
jgi:hypothetical protein